MSASPARTARRSLVASVVFLAAAAIAAGCGGAPGGGGADAAGIVPTDAAVVMRVDLREGDGSSWAQAREALNRIPAWRSFVDAQIPPRAQLATSVLGSLGTSEEPVEYERDIKPWLGDTGGAALWRNEEYVRSDDEPTQDTPLAPEGDAGTGTGADAGADADAQPEPASYDGSGAATTPVVERTIEAGGSEGEQLPVDVIAWVEASDEDAARAAMRRMLGEEDAGEHEGVQLSEGSGDAAGTFWATFADSVVVASSQQALEASIDAHEGDAYEEGDDWERLSQPEGEGETMLSAIITESAAGQLREALEDDQLISDEELESSELGSREQLLAQVQQYEDNGLLHSAFHVVALEGAVGIEALSAAPVDEVGSDEVSAVELAALLPADSVAAFGMEMNDEAMEESLRQLGEAFRTQVLPLRDELDEGGAGATADERRVRAAMEGFIEMAEGWAADDQLKQDFLDGYGEGSVASLRVREDGTLGLLSAAQVDDRDAVWSLDERLLGDIEEYVNGLGYDVRMEVEQQGDDARSIAVTGIPVQRLLRDMPPAQRRQVMANPIAGQFLQERIESKEVIGDSWQVWALPAEDVQPALEALDAEEEGLGGQQRYQRDLDAAGVPDDATSIGWVDLLGLNEGIVQRIDRRVYSLADAQLEHVGGPVGWGEEVEDGFVRSRVLLLTYQ